MTTTKKDEESTTKVVCEYCGGAKFLVWEKTNCSDCIFNAYELFNELSGEYEYHHTESKRNGSERTQVDSEGKCSVGYASGAGCMLMQCTECGKFKNRPFKRQGE
jgi:hypothetical protein